MALGKLVPFHSPQDQVSLNSLKLVQTLDSLIGQLVLGSDGLRHRPFLALDFSAVKLLWRSSWELLVEGARLSQR